MGMGHPGGARAWRWPGAGLEAGPPRLGRRSAWQCISCLLFPHPSADRLGAERAERGGREANSLGVELGLGRGARWVNSSLSVSSVLFSRVAVVVPPIPPANVHVSEACRPSTSRAASRRSGDRVKPGPWARHGLKSINYGKSASEAGKADSRSRVLHFYPIAQLQHGPGVSSRRYEGTWDFAETLLHQPFKIITGGCGEERSIGPATIPMMSESSRRTVTRSIIHTTSMETRFESPALPP